MPNITINQHYVYREYLRKWATNEHIFCLRNKNIIFETNLVNIAQERYFYRFNESSDEDFAIAYSFADEYSKNIIKIFESINNSLKIAHLNKNKELEKIILDFSKDADEKFFNCNTEINLNNLLKKIYNKDLSSFNDYDFKMKACYAISEQYCRTNKIKYKFVKDILSEANVKNYNMINIWFLLRHVLAYKIGLALCYQNYKFCLLENTNSGFITGDQPVINTFADYETPAKEFELYYPITPSLALFITKDSAYVNEKIYLINDEQVSYYNKLIADCSLNQLFAENEDKLVIFKNK